MCSRDRRELDQFDCRKINAIPLDISCGQLPTHQLCVRTDEEIGQRYAGSFASARTSAGEPIAVVGAATNDCCGDWKVKDGDASSAHVLFDFLAAPRAGI